MKTIGVLLDHKVFRRTPSRRTGHERVDFYHKAARKFGASAFFMSLKNMDLKQNRATGYVWADGRYRRVTRPIPKVIHNRTLEFQRLQVRRLKRLSAMKYVYNASNRYSKYRIHKLLKQTSAFEGNLPPTRVFGRKQLSAMMSRYTSLYIKPQSGSVGKGILRLKKLKSGLWSVRLRKKAYTLHGEQIFAKLKAIIGKRPYLIQKGIELAHFNGHPYDLRVSVQKGSNGLWKVTGIVGKVARKGSHVTNVARGGKVMRCERLFAGSRLPVSLTKMRVRNLSLRITSYLANKLYRLSDVGLDIGVDRYGNPYFIEMNGRDQRYTFRLAGLKKTFFETYENPIRYGLYVARRKSGGLRSSIEGDTRENRAMGAVEGRQRGS